MLKSPRQASRTRLLGLALALCLAPLLMCAVASAQAHCPRGTARFNYRFSVNGSDGYRVTVEAFPGGGKAKLLAERTDRSAGEETTDFASYAVPAKIGCRGFSADFGALGRIAIHAPRLSPLEFRFSDEGKGAQAELRGTIEFHGEEGFTALSRRHVPGAVRRLDHRSNREAALASDTPAGGSSRTLTSVAAAERLPDRLVYLLLQSSEPPFASDSDGDFAITTLEERRPGMNISRSVDLKPTPQPAISPAGLDSSSGTVTLPPPFAGTAGYSRSPDASLSWSGDLTVALPGAAGQPLTGPGFTAFVCSTTAETDKGHACEEEARELTRPLFLRH